MGDRLIDFETVLDDTGAAAPPAEPVAAPVATPEPAGWGGPSREDWERTQMFQQAILEALNEPDDPADLVNQPQGPEIPPELHAFVEQRAKELLDQQVGPYMPVLNDIAAERGKATLFEHFDKLSKGDEAAGVQGLGEFDRDEAAVKAQIYFGQGVDPQQAVRAAAQAQIEFERRFATQVLERQQQQLQNRLNAPQEPGSPSSSAEPVPTQQRPGMNRYESVAADWLEHRRVSGSPVG